MLPDKRRVAREVEDTRNLMGVLEELYGNGGAPLGSVDKSAESLIHLVREKLDSVILQLGGNGYSSKKNDELRREYLESLQARRAGSTLLSEGSRLKQFIEFIDNPPRELDSEPKSLFEVDHEDVRRFADSLAGRNLRVGSITKSISRIRCFFKYLHQRYGFDALEISDIRGGDYRTKVPDAHEREPLSREEMRALIQAPDNVRDRLVIAKLYVTGVRVKELANIKLDDVDLETGAVHVIKGKGGKSRWVWYNPDDIGWLVKLWLERERGSYLNAGDSDYFFVGKSGKKLHPNQIRRIVHKAAVKVGIQKVVGRDARGKPIYRVTPHVLRHTHIAHAEEDGIDKKVTQLMMGHENLSTTLQYGKPRVEKLFAAYKKFRGVSAKRTPRFFSKLKEEDEER